MADFIKYKGFKIVKCQSGYYSAWGKSVFYPIDNMYFSSKSFAAVKRHINEWLKVNKIKNWCTLYTDVITKDVLVWPR